MVNNIVNDCYFTVDMVVNYKMTINIVVDLIMVITVVKFGIIIIVYQNELISRLLQAYFMAIKDDAITQKTLSQTLS